MIEKKNYCMPAVLCRCWCNCHETVAYIGLGQKEPEDKGDSSLICENCLGEFHEQDRIDANVEQMREDELSENDKDDAVTILDKRLARGEITLEEFTATKKAVMGKEENNNIESGEMLPEDRLSLNLKTAYAEFAVFLEEAKKRYDDLLKINHSTDEPDVKRLRELIKRTEQRLAEHENAVAKKLDHEIEEKNHQISQLQLEKEELKLNQMTNEKIEYYYRQGKIKGWDEQNRDTYHDLLSWKDEVKKNFGLLGNKKPVVIIFKEVDGKLKPVRGDDDL
ncbi:MAG: hypothetical protein KGL95_02810, partial [Patescibacteria group bacterium]|nr:hypothetical protein [Patescibacteria group bacterium]